MSQSRRRSVTVLAVLVITSVASLTVATGADAGVPAPAAGTGWGRTLTPASGPGAFGTPAVDAGPAAPRRRGRVHGLSRNWSGYIATGSKFTSVEGEWRVPTVGASTVTTRQSATWIGIDGVDNRSLIQTGTAQDSSSTGASYFAWVGDPAPRPAQEIGPVSPGDEMRASIVDDSPGTWTITIADEHQARRASRARSATADRAPPPNGSKRRPPRPAPARS